LDDQVTVLPVSTAPLASLRAAASCRVAPTPMLAVAGVIVTDATGTAAVVVVPLAIVDSAPNTASTFSVPRNATSWNWYAVARASPNTVQVRFAPTALPATGVA